LASRYNFTSLNFVTSLEVTVGGCFSIQFYFIALRKITRSDGGGRFWGSKVQRFKRFWGCGFFDTILLHCISQNHLKRRLIVTT